MMKADRAAPIRLLSLLLLLLSAPAAGLAAAPASQYPASTLRPDDLRVATVAYRLALAGRSYCHERYPLSGLLLHHLAEYDTAGRAYQIAAYRLDRGPGVLAVVANSPAAMAGLRAGDVILDAGGMPFPDSRAIAAERDRKRWRAMVEYSESRLEAAFRQGPTIVRILRNGQIATVTLSPVQGCPMRVRLARSSQGNAFATGRFVVMTTRLLAALRRDDELAILLGHELAHNVLRLDQNRGETHGDAARAGGRPIRGRAAEKAADRLGLKFAWAAGYDIHAAIPMWRRLHKTFSGPQIFSGHPSLGARERLTKQVIREIEAAGSEP